MKTKLKITAALLAYCLAIPALCAFLESQEADASRSSAQAAEESKPSAHQ